jgi:signal transduction histidine kinase
MMDDRWSRRLPGIALGLVLFVALVPLTVRSPVIVDVAGLGGLLGVTFLVIRMEMGRRWAEAVRSKLLARERVARAEAEATSRSKDEFFATISHELRGPLSAMLSWLYLLRSGKLDEASAAHALETIERNVKNEAHIVEDLLEVSRIIGGNVRLDTSPVVLTTIVEETVDSVRPAAGDKGIHVETQSMPASNTVSGDPARLRQVMENLLSNAIKFTPKGGRVAVRLESDETHAIITVGDTGQGIRPDFLPYVFDRFCQDETAARSRGLGLGLAIVRHLVELHGGTVRAASDGEGQGATFAVTLPLDLDDVASGPADRSSAAPDLNHAVTYASGRSWSTGVAWLSSRSLATNAKT